MSSDPSPPQIIGKKSPGLRPPRETPGADTEVPVTVDDDNHQRQHERRRFNFQLSRLTKDTRAQLEKLIKGPNKDEGKGQPLVLKPLEFKSLKDFESYYAEKLNERLGLHGKEAHVGDQVEGQGSDADEEDNKVHDQVEESEPANISEINVGDDGSPQCQNPSTGPSCRTCRVNFNSFMDQRAHFHLDWHRYNVKRLLKNTGLEPVAESYFDEMMDDLSSISGSDSDVEISEDTAPMERSTISDKSQANKESVNRLIEKISLNNSEVEDDLEGQDDQRLMKSSKVFFETGDLGTYLGIYKVALPCQAQNSQEPSISLNYYPSLKWTIIMISGGHFAGAVFEGGKEILHKTFHRYTVRAKQGGAQSARDASKTSNHSSAGSNLRRYNEAAFAQDIQKLLESWKGAMDECDLIFCKAISWNQNIIFNGYGSKPPVIDRANPRLRSIPCPTKRPTLNEIKLVFKNLTSLKVYDLEEFWAHYISDERKQGMKTKGINKPNRARSRPPVIRELPNISIPEPEESDSGSGDPTFELVDEEIDFKESLEEFGDSLSPAQKQKVRARSRRKPQNPSRPKPKSPVLPDGLVGELFKLLTLPKAQECSGEHQTEPTTANSNVPCSDEVDVDKRLTQILKNDLSKYAAEGVPIPDELINQLNSVIDENKSTLLHLATKRNCLQFMWALLEFGAEPVLKDKMGKYPYNWAESKEARVMYRKFRADFPDKYDYSKAQIPEPLTEDQEAEKAERKRLLNKLKREKEKAKKLERKQKEEEEAEAARYINLSDREKRALAAERRLLTSCSKSGLNVPVLVRCFQCAKDISGKTPFEYNSNLFCSTKCLRAHREKSQPGLSV